MQVFALNVELTRQMGIPRVKSAAVFRNYSAIYYYRFL